MEDYYGAGVSSSAVETQEEDMLLSANTRKLILKFPFAREATNLIINVKNSRFYKKLNKDRHFDCKIYKMQGTCSGRRCFIVGNGPSLTIEQLEKIKNEDSFGANRIYKMFGKTSWRPQYYVIQDKYDSTVGVYENLDVNTLFVSDFYWNAHGMENPNAICYHIKRNLKQSAEIPFSDQISEYVQAAATVTYTMIQIAAYLGYSEIYLIGMDHTYANITNDKGEIVQHNNVKNHAFDDEKPNEVVANVEYMDLAYRSAKDYCDRHNIKIRNATLGGALEVFERCDFWDL